MMKKNGFTLAEVLITLAIIGVVAVLTLPALTSNTAEQQAKTALKKGINTLTEAAQMNQAITGMDYATLTSNNTSSLDSPSLYGLLANRTNLNYPLNGTTTKSAKLVNSGVDSGSSTGGNFVVFFRDGSALSYDPTKTTIPNEAITKLEGDGLVHGFGVIFDTNGSKGPNLYSNCNGKTSVRAKDADASTDKGGDCSNVTKRVIKDQFGLRLRGGIVVPNGPAAKWAFEN